MNYKDSGLDLFGVMRREPILTIIAIVFWAVVGWWTWSTVTYGDIAEEDRQYCYLVAGVASDAAEDRILVDKRSFRSQLRRDIGGPLTPKILDAIELAYNNTLMTPTELWDHVKAHCLLRMRQANQGG